MKKIIWTFIMLMFFVSSAFWISEEFFANYQIDDEMDRMIEIFSRIEAYRSTWNDVPQEIFVELSWIFNTVLPRLPQTPENRVIYEQCDITTRNMSWWFNYDRFLTFRDRCFQPLNDIIRQIDTNYTVIPDIDANPDSWSAPLNVTLDARGSIDPSEDTIPTNNFFWYYRDGEWNYQEIWRWPVLNYTFEQEWNYVVHLTVRSANNQQGIFDGSTTKRVNVWPETAVISVHANWDRMDWDEEVRVGTQEAQRWIVFDWSGTYPTWWRRIESTTWQIEWPNDFSRSFTRNSSPSSFRESFPTEWEYTITLIIEDNQNNTVERSFPLIVEDPVSKANIEPQEWDSSTTFNFDASPSYSVRSTIENYSWTIFDPDGDEMEEIQQRSFDRIFEQPWTYSLRLSVSDALWNQNDKQININVESTSPVPQFTKEATQKREYPSEYIFDASASYDEDHANWYSDMEYDWSFSNSNNVEIKEEIDGWEKIRVAFNQPWEYTVELTVRDDFWKSESIEKEVEIESSLRPRINLSPKASIRWEEIQFSVESNQDISFYEWDFGDWNRKQTQNDTVNYSYDETWVYTVKLNVHNEEWEENSVERRVFIWEEDHPIAVYDVTYDDTSLSPEGTCTIEEDWEEIEKDAFEVERYQNIRVDAGDSVNSEWRTNDRNISMRPKNDQIYRSERMNYDFNEKWCTYIDLNVEDEITNRTDSRRIYFDVQNALPKLDNLEMSFPQHWNEIWVWFWQQQMDASSKFETDYDPLMVSIRATWARDPDWHISRFIWYYYKKSNPWRYKQVKTTPRNVQSTTFSIPRVPWEYVFWVRIKDNDWGEIDSEEVIWRWPSLYFPPSTDNPDVPTASLSASTMTTRVWEEIEFSVDTEILSNDENFEREKTLRYDFDWDWEYDLTTRDTEVTHIYEEPWDYRPRVKVNYRWYSWVDQLDKIEVQEWLKTRFLYDTFWKKAIFRDVSYWNIERTRFCLDYRYCDDSWDDFTKEDEEYFKFEYEDEWRKIVQLSANDKYWNTDSFRERINISEKDDFWFMSIPNAKKEDDTYKISVWSTLNNSILFYVPEIWDWDCYLNFDISHDSTWDWDPSSDKDLFCGNLSLHHYTPSADSTIARITYEKDWEKKTEDIEINFLDIDIELPEDKKEVYNELSMLLNQIDQDWEEKAYLRSLLINLRNSLQDWIATDSIVIQIYDWIEDNEWLLPSSKESKIEEILDKLSTTWIQAALWSTEYETARWNIILFTPDEDKDKVRNLFQQIEWASGDRDYIEWKLRDILEIAEWHNQQWNIDDMDYNIIQSDICRILEYYDIPSTACWTEQEVEEDFTDDADTWIFWSVIRIILYVVWFIFFLFFVLVIIFAIKARNQSSTYTEEWEEETEEDDSEQEDDEDNEYKDEKSK